MKRNLIIAAALLLSVSRVFAFCGFYVAKADAKLFNKSSQVIIARDGDHTVITMSNDFQGDVKDFAIVIPVPVVLQESDIRVVQQYIFDKLDAYTAPRLVDYYDENPCQDYRRLERSSTMAPTAAGKSMVEQESMADDNLGVTIEATYTVGEYDILVLSAKESDGLKIWLTSNGYKLPDNAEEVLDPYIKDGTKFFVAKVNLEQHKAGGFTALRPLQIQFDSPKFMLPIRLGMANATGAQDLLVYGFTRKGRMEVSNYRTTKLPTDRDIPEFVQTHGIFGDFYKSLFEKAWKNEGRNSVMLEYAWDISGQQSVKCDPCPTPLVSFAELREAGVWWINSDPWGQGYTGDLFITRLHARYSRDKFPQDLQFISTPNKQQFQGRYVVRHAATGPMDCEEGKRYQAELKRRKRNEVMELAALTNWNPEKYAWYYGGGVEPGSTGSTKTDTTTDSSVLPSLFHSQVDPRDSSSSIAGVSDEEMLQDSSAFIQRARQASANPMRNRMVIFVAAVALLVVSLAFRKRQAANVKGDSAGQN